MACPGMQRWECGGDGLDHIGQRRGMILKNVNVSVQNSIRSLELIF